MPCYRLAVGLAPSIARLALLAGLLLRRHPRPARAPQATPIRGPTLARPNCGGGICPLAPAHCRPAWALALRPPCLSRCAGPCLRGAAPLAAPPPRAPPPALPSFPAGRPVGGLRRCAVPFLRRWGGARRGAPAPPAACGLGSAGGRAARPAACAPRLAGPACSPALRVSALRPCAPPRACAGLLSAWPVVYSTRDGVSQGCGPAAPACAALDSPRPSCSAPIKPQKDANAPFWRTLALQTYVF